MANNHLGDGGLYAVADEIGYARRRLGIAHAGAGANNPRPASAAWLTAGGIRIAVLAYCWIAADGVLGNVLVPGLVRLLDLSR
jgi:poly-gamma-glutamate capsule biosynthesis protein CapA/YwtB (metallophosphatase superfamily)